MRNLIKRNLIFLHCYLILFLSGLASCKKLVEIPPPITSITTPQVFSSDGQVNSALAGIYTRMIKDQGSAAGSFCDGATTIYCGLSADELIPFRNTGDNFQFRSDALLSSNASILGGFWTPAYFYIYQTNSIIAGLSASTAIDDSAKSEFLGEAKFIRAFSYFYLVNLFGDVPLVLTTDFDSISRMARTPKSQVYHQIIQDLQIAKSLLPDGYLVGGGERIRPNRWSAAALVARTYLYLGQWDSAESQASSIIENPQYALVGDLNHVFDKNSTEAIWQLQLSLGTSPSNETYEGANFQPANSAVGVSSAVINLFPYLFIPNFSLSSQLVDAFEANDQRKSDWINSVVVKSVTYNYPNKYIIGPQQRSDQGPIPQYYMVLRLAEQYLIRAEARTQIGTGAAIAGAIDDLNTIRNRAQLPPTPASSSSQLLIAVQHERQTELFAEWGHRWMDLKRTAQIDNVLESLKPGWNSSDALYPIPRSELITDPALVQNVGY